MLLLLLMVLLVRLRLVLLLRCQIYAWTRILSTLKWRVLITARRVVPPLTMLVNSWDRCLLRFVPLGSIRLA